MDIQRTGSIAQDALRLGFQTTCTKGLEVLLKVEDLTTEACQEFKKRHLQEVKETVDQLSDKLIEECRQRDTETDHVFSYKSYRIPILHPSWWKQRRYEYKRKNQKSRKCEVAIDYVGDPKLDTRRGEWKTTIKYTLKSHPWKGWHEGSYQELEAEKTSHIYEVITSAMKCNLEFIPYDEYSERYIPDEAAQAAYDATVIGLRNLRVVKPVIANVDRDPIIIGHINNEMFIIAWFGYDKNNHMACNV